ncbi:MAG: hypothetical protein AAGJ95_11835 [Cyanobacteria bacterium J06554_11]
MRRYFVSLLKYGTPHCSIDTDPPSDGGEGGGGGGGAGEPQPDISALQTQLTEYKKVINNYRQKESSYESALRQQKRMEALLGDISPDKLVELRDAENKLASAKEQQEQRLLEERNAVASEYKQQIEQLNQKTSQYEQEIAGQRKEYELFKAFNANGGIPERFNGFVRLAADNFKRAQDNSMQVFDDTGKLVIFNDKNGDRAATPADFLQMLASGQLDESYTFNDLELMKLTTQAYNKSSGSGLPSNNGYNASKPLSEMSQTELAQIAFKG